MSMGVGYDEFHEGLSQWYRDHPEWWEEQRKKQAEKEMKEIAYEELARRVGLRIPTATQRYYKRWAGGLE